MDELNKAIDNASLKEAIKNVRENYNPHTQTKMLEELINAKFLSPVEVAASPDESGKIVLDKGAEIKLNIINSSKGEKYLLAFTDWTELNKWKNSEFQQTMLTTFEDFSKILFDNGDNDCKGFVINPFGENLPIDRRNMISIMEFAENRRKAKESQKITVKMGEPKEYPHNMINALKEYMKTDSRIKKAYLQMILKNNRPGYFIALDYDGDKTDVFNAVGNLALKYLENGLTLDVMPLYSSDYTEYLLEKVKPFYEKL